MTSMADPQRPTAWQQEQALRVQLAAHWPVGTLVVHRDTRQVGEVVVIDAYAEVGPDPAHDNRRNHVLALHPCVVVHWPTGEGYPDPAELAPMPSPQLDLTEPTPCRTCGGMGCEYGCGRCEMAYSGPDSHRICRTCRGAGTTPT